MAQTGIHKRGVTSFFTLFGFIIMSIIRLMLCVVPVGRVANWTDWGNSHILSSLLFIVAAVLPA